MKTYLIVGSALVSFFTIMFSNNFGQQTETENKWVISIHYMTLQDGVEPEEARNYLENKWFKLFEETPGMNAMLGKPDRGGAKGDFVIIYKFDSKLTRDYYYPKEGQYGEPIKKVVEKYQSIYDEAYGTYFVQEKSAYDEYLLFARAK